MKVIAIDGPSAAGKSTIAKLLAKRLGWTYLDTGAMYRAVALKADRSGTDLEDDGALENLSKKISIEFRPTESGEQLLLIDGEDATELIREHRISDLASRVSARMPVRAAMAEQQRRLGERAPSVVEGRDIGSVIFPDAILKVYMTASDQVRTRRRLDELAARGQSVQASEVLQTIKQRDNRDLSRENAPLKKVPDAEMIDTTDMTVETVIDHIERLLQRKLKEQHEN